jgi:hypothetical protein
MSTYQPGSVRDYIVESYSGMHDFLGHPWTYNSAGYQEVSKSLFGAGLTRVFGGGFASTVSDVMAAVDIPLATPFAIASNVDGYYYGYSSAIKRN